MSIVWPGIIMTSNTDSRERLEVSRINEVGEKFIITTPYSSKPSSRRYKTEAKSQFHAPAFATAESAPSSTWLPDGCWTTDGSLKTGTEKSF
jgi:hypothetical protein